MWCFTYAILLLQIIAVTGEANDRFDLRCFSCPDASDPMSCNSYETCGAGEECFTRQINDHLGKTAYRLGCESKSLCKLFKDAVSIVGKRAVSLSKGCFQCCDADNCNSALCSLNGTTTQGKTTVGLPVSVTHIDYNVSAARTAAASTSPTTETVTTTTCASTYLTGVTSCYLFINSSHTWHEGDVLCKQLGGELLSINDKAEDDFITNYLNSLPGSTSPAGYWVGGIFDKAANRWMWTDGTEMTYVRWGPRHLSYINYHVNLANPRVRADFNEWAWSTDVEYEKNRWVICEHAFT